VVREGRGGGGGSQNADLGRAVQGTPEALAASSTSPNCRPKISPRSSALEGVEGVGGQAMHNQQHPQPRRTCVGHRNEHDVLHPCSGSLQMRGCIRYLSSQYRLLRPRIPVTHCSENWRDKRLLVINRGNVDEHAIRARQRRSDCRVESNGRLCVPLIGLSPTGERTRASVGQVPRGK